MSRRRGPRGLDPDEGALWSEITKSIKPLRGRRIATASIDALADVTRERDSPPKRELSRAAPALKAPPPLTNLDRRSRSRVARGRIEIDARLDLHGMTLQRARARLSAFLLSAQARGASFVLVITGKGSGPGGERGALRREVPQWLSLSEFRPLVIGFEEAAPAHGGAGALYVRIRRARL
jgi:DNA-nicking Smr family endonuclease